MPYCLSPVSKNCLWRLACPALNWRFDSLDPSMERSIDRLWFSPPPFIDLWITLFLLALLKCPKGRKRWKWKQLRDKLGPHTEKKKVQMAEKWNGENPKPKSLNPALGGNGLENCIELFSPSPFLSANAQFILRNMEMGKRAQMAHDSFRSLFNALYVSITLLQRITRLDKPILQSREYILP